MFIAASSRRIVKPLLRAARLSSSSSSTEPPLFPCVDAHAIRESRIKAIAQNCTETGPEPPYARPNPASYHTYQHPRPLPLSYSPTPLPPFTIAYETWGTLNAARDNAVLLHTGLSASSHAAATPTNPAPGWWDKFIGPGKAVDTETYFVICTNVLGGCYGSTGPSSIEQATGKPWATRFPIISIFDMVRAQFFLLDHLGIDKLYASVGSSMGAMQSLAAGLLHPARIGKLVSISGTSKSSPSSIAMRFAQRSVLMADPNWNKGFYYDGLPPHIGMKLARQIATITYRSGPEWEQRFGRQLREIEDLNISPRPPALCPDFLIETYLDYQGEQFCLKYDANSLIYISKAMDLFDMSLSALQELNLAPKMPASSSPAACFPSPAPHITPHSDLVAGLAPLEKIPSLILGVQSDILFPVEQQREFAAALRATGNDNVSYYELGGVWGHDTFLIDVQNVGGAIRGFLS